MLFKLKNSIISRANGSKLALNNFRLEIRRKTSSHQGHEVLEDPPNGIVGTKIA